MANQRTDSKNGGTVKVTLLKSPIGFNRNQGDVVRSMGLRRIRHTVELKDTPETRGMIHKVRHLVTVGSNRCGRTRSMIRIMSLNNLQAAQGREAPEEARSAAARARATARPPAAATRARSRGRASSSSAGSKAARCRCTAACRSAAFTTRSASSTTSSTSTRSPRRFDAGAVVTPELLREHGLVPRRRRLVKVLARGEIGKALTVRAHKFSGKAAEKIAAAGGTGGSTSRSSR